MSSVRALTGGSHDVNPQPLRARVVPASFTGGLAPAFGTTSVATVAIPIPVQRLASGGRAQVLEILKWQYDVNLTTPTSAAQQWIFSITISTRSNSTNEPAMGCADPYTIDHVKFESAPATGTTSHQASGQRDLTDGAGHGVLMGMDTIYIQCGLNASQAAATAGCTGAANVCIWYRWKNVGFSEYVGMVTSS